MTDDSRCRLYGHHKISSVRSGIREDILRFATFSPAYRPEPTFKTTVSIFFQPSILCLFLYRTAHYLCLRRWRRLAHAVSRFNLMVHKANIPAESCIGPGCFLGHCPGVTFHGSAGSKLTMLSLAVCCPNEDSFGWPAEKGPCLGDGVTVGAHAVVIGPVNVGDEVKVATNAWLNVDCPSNKLVCSTKIRQTLRPLGESPVSDAAAE